MGMCDALNIQASATAIWAVARKGRKKKEMVCVLGEIKMLDPNVDT